MRNHTASNYRKAGTPEVDPMASAIQSGWEDYRLGRPYRVDFDLLDRDTQNNYEAGRRVAAALRRHMPLPAWPIDKAFQEVMPPITAQAAADFTVENALTSGVKT